MFNSNLRFPFPSFFFLDRYRFLLNLTFLDESVFSFFFFLDLYRFFFFSWSPSCSRECSLSFFLGRKRVLSLLFSFIDSHHLFCNPVHAPVGQKESLITPTLLLRPYSIKPKHNQRPFGWDFWSRSATTCSSSSRSSLLIIS